MVRDIRSLHLRSGADLPAFQGGHEVILPRSFTRYREHAKLAGQTKKAPGLKPERPRHQRLYRSFTLI
jgi:hypothetical protein